MGVVQCTNAPVLAARDTARAGPCRVPPARMLSWGIRWLVSPRAAHHTRRHAFFVRAADLRAADMIDSSHNTGAQGGATAWAVLPPSPPGICHGSRVQRRHARLIRAYNLPTTTYCDMHSTTTTTYYLLLATTYLPSTRATTFAADYYYLLLHTAS